MGVKDFQAKFGSIMLALLLALTLVSASQTTLSQLGLRQGVSTDPWHIFDTDTVFGATYTLANASSGGPNQILTPNVSASDLPNDVLICPGTLSLDSATNAVWNVTRFAGNSTYPKNVPCPV
ncbi:MAG: hypothetical protein KGH63_01040, partial [Candidatus Micrarchaeota archaeon]|nr:hypothetical protein [Candidatus Micrarchaeota archaeon]